LHPARRSLYPTATTEIYTLSLHDALPIWLGAEVPAYFDIVGRLSTRVDPKTKEVERVLQTEKSADVIAKDRTRRLEAMVVNPSIDRKSTRLNSSHVKNSYAVVCLTKKHTH